jgi:hypothetical protein
VGDSDGMTYLFVFLFTLSVLLGNRLYAQDGESVLSDLGYTDYIRRDLDEG